MAFCTRSERKMEFQEKSPLIPGPGYYDKLTPTNEQNYNRIFPPFSTSGNRIPIENKNNVPGPGSYNLDSNNSNSIDNISPIKINKYKKSNKKNNNIFRFSLNNTNSSIISKKKIIDKCISTKDLIPNKTVELFCSNLESSLNYPFYQNEKLGFLSQAIRFDKKNDIDSANSPGPGSYLSPIRKAINESKIKEKFDNRLFRTASFEKNGSICSFINNSSKIKINTNSDCEEKNISFNSSQEATTTSKGNLINNTFQNNSNLSMITNNDSKNILNKTNNILIIEPIIEKSKNKNNKNESIGPGYYNALLTKKNNNAINWSKGFNLKQIRQKNELIKKLKLIEEMKKKGDVFLRNKNTQCQSPKEMKSLKNDKKKINSSRSSYIPNKNGIPGPGYYGKETTHPEIDIFNKKNKNLDEEANQCFGSRSERFMNKCISVEDLGPTTYFMPKNKYEETKKVNIYQQLKLGKNRIKRNYDSYQNNSNLINSNKKEKNNSVSSTSKTDRTILSEYNSIKELNPDKKNQKLRSLKKMNLNSFNQTQDSRTIYSKSPGPGTYELSHNFIKQSFSLTPTMESKNKRFTDDDNGNPGPGSYEKLKTFESCWQIVLKKFLEKKYNNYQLDKKKEERIKKIIELNKMKNEIPGVGSYNIDKKNSINYKISSKYNAIQCYESPFLNSSGRFMYNTNDDISPASYDPYKYEKKNKNNQYKIFNKENRFNNELRPWIIAGPGSYDLEPLWNKKSFNILFSSYK